jgi:raffinose/stachyose/melibiose transport system permease protein
MPALLIYSVFMAGPLLDSVRLSLYTGSASNRSFAGFENYARLFSGGEITARFWGAFGHTWVFFAIHMLVQNVLGILFATVLTLPNMRGRQTYQTIIFLPTTLAVLVTGYLWKLMLNPLWTRDVLNVMGLGALVRPWLGEASTALTAVSLVSCWQWMGIPTMMFVAALRNVPDDLLEAASIEGANTWGQFWRIKLPLIMPVVGMIAILTFVNNFNAFDAVFAMEGPDGPPGYATDLIGTLFYRTGIAGQHPIGIPDPGLGAAIATVTFLMLACGVVPTLKLTQAKE